MKPALWAVSLAALAAGSLLGQQVISAKAGLVHYVEGRVLLDGRPVNPRVSEASDPKFPQMKDNSVLAAEDGRAEILLTPGVFLWLGENSEMSMLSTRITAPSFLLNRGSALLEVDELLDGSSVTVRTGKAAVTLAKAGVYRFDAEPCRVMVYAGEASAEAGGQMQRVAHGKLLMLDGTMVSEKFDTQAGDALFRWARRRGEYFSMANVSAAHRIQNTYLDSWDRSQWIWNPYFGMFTWVPRRAMFTNYWGYTFWSPYTVYAVYNPRPVFTGGGGGGAGWNMDAGPRGISAAPSGVSGVVAASSTAAATRSTPAPPPPAASSPRPGGGAPAGRSR